MEHLKLKSISGRDSIWAHFAIFSILLGSSLAIVHRAEYFPFSNYPMYSRASKLPATAYQFSGVVENTSDEKAGAKVGEKPFTKEIPFSRPEFLFPFTERTLSTAVVRMLKENGQAAAERAMNEELILYNNRREIHGGPTLIALRLYTLSVKLTKAGDLEDKDYHLIAEAKFK